MTVVTTGALGNSVLFVPLVSRRGGEAVKEDLVRTRKRCEEWKEWKEQFGSWFAIFESIEDVAQTGERLLEKQEAGGSIPFGPIHPATYY